MARREIKAEGKDVGEAITKGLHELGRRRDQVEVTVLQEEKPGFLGIGSKPAVVKIIEKKWDSENSTPMKPRSFTKRNIKNGKVRKHSKRKISCYAKMEKEPKESEVQKLPSLEIQNAVIPENLKEPMKVAKESFLKIIEGIGAKAENVNIWWDQKQERMLITFDCDSPALIIGKEGHTLESIQYIITLIVSRYFDNPISVICDTQNYWRKLEDKVNEEIERAVKMLLRTKKIYRFRPMSAQRRRYIHRYLADRQDISTASEGEGKWRKVVLKIKTAEVQGEAAAITPQESLNAKINQAVSYGQDTQEALRKMQEEQAKAAMAAEEEAQATQTVATAEAAVPEITPVQEQVAPAPAEVEQAPAEQAANQTENSEQK